MTLERKWIQQLQTRWPQVDFRHDTFYDEGSRQILTTDMLVEGVHFSWDYFTPEDLGWRAVAMNLSDIAATGGTPSWVMVDIGVPKARTLKLLEGIYQGIDDCCKVYHCQVIGGDTVRSENTVLSVTVVGRLPAHATPGRRTLAEPGDILATSGPHGLSQAGLEALHKNLSGFEKAKAAHLRPVPQLRMGQQIAQVVPRFAMMDSSDGLADAVLRLAEASGVDIVLRQDRLSIDPDVNELAQQMDVDPLDWVLYGGEDFQLVATLPPETLGIFPELQPIGYVKPASRPGRGRGFLATPTTMAVLRAEKAFQHFSKKEAPST